MDDMPADSGTPKNARDITARLDQYQREHPPTLEDNCNAAIADAGRDFLDAYRRSIIEHVGE